MEAGLISRRWVPHVLEAATQFRLLYGSQVLSVLGDRVTSVALPFAVLATGGDVRDVALVSAAHFLPFVLLAVPAGVWADRIERTRILLASDAVRLASQAIAATLLFSHSASPAHLMITAAVYGAADAFFAPALSGLLPSTVARDHLQPANALRGLSYSAGNVLGPALAGLLIAVAGPGAALAFDAATFALSLLFLLRLRQQASDLRVETPTSVTGSAARRAVGQRESQVIGVWLRSLRDGGGAVRSRPWVSAFLLAMSTYHVVVLPGVFVLGPVLIEQDYAGAGSWVLITIGFGIGSALGDLIFLWWRPRHALAIAAAALSAASCQPGLIGSGLPAWATGVLIAGCGIGVTGAFTLWTTTLGEHIPSNVLSRVASYDQLVTTGAIPLGNVIAGIAGAAWGLRPALVAMTVIGVSVCLAVVSLRSVRTLPRARVVLRGSASSGKGHG